MSKKVSKKKKVQNKGGRQTKLTKDRQDMIISLIVQGHYAETAAAYAGIDTSTLYRWIRRGKRERERIEKGNEPQIKEVRFVRFSRAIEKAFAEAEMRDMDRVSNAGKNDWKAAAWRLERKWKKRVALHEQDEEHDLKLEILKKELEMKEIEIKNLRGDNLEDAHEQGSSYEEALLGQVRTVFIDDWGEDDGEKEEEIQ